MHTSLIHYYTFSVTRVEFTSMQLYFSSVTAENNSHQKYWTNFNVAIKFTWSSDRTRVLKIGASCNKLINDIKYDLIKRQEASSSCTYHEGIQGSRGMAEFIRNLTTTQGQVASYSTHWIEEVGRHHQFRRFELEINFNLVQIKLQFLSFPTHRPVSILTTLPNTFWF